MNFNDGTTQRDLDRSKTAVDKSFEDPMKSEGEHKHDHLDKEAMHSAERAQNRIHQGEQDNPEDAIFTK